MCYNVMMDIRQIIANRMEQRGITQTALQAMTGIHQVRISDYLNGKRDMTGDNVAMLLDALGLAVRPAEAPETRRRGKMPQTPTPKAKKKQKAPRRKGR